MHLYLTKLHIFLKKEQHYTTPRSKKEVANNTLSEIRKINEKLSCLLQVIC